MGTLVLVAGFLPVDSGKTTLAASLARALRGLGFDVAVSKPVGAVDLWRSPWVLDEVERLGLVVSGDAVSLVRAAEIDLDLAVVNPLAFLLAPLDPERVEWRLDAYTMLSGEEARRTVLFRVTGCHPGGVASVQAVNLKALERLPKPWAERLEGAAASLRPGPVRAGDELAQRALAGGNLAAADSCLRMLVDKHEVIVVESQSDVAAPTPLSAAADVVIVAAPGKAAVYEGSRYARAINVAAGGLEAAHTVRVSDVTRLTRPKASLDLPVLSDPRTGYPDDALATLVSEVERAVG